MKVLLLGADGFIGRHIAFYLREQGVEVTCLARNPARLARMGFATVMADLTHDATHAPAFWQPHLPPGTHLINAAGLLTGTSANFEAVHSLAPQAALQALDPQARALLISAVGVTAETPFALWRRQTEALFARHTILRPGLVLGDTSYGGSSMLRALAAFPIRIPVVGGGQQRFNPMHARDLAAVVLECLRTPPGAGPWDVGGPEIVTQTRLVQLYRRWLGLPAARLLHLPLPVAVALAGLGDLFRLGPISTTALRQLEHGVLSDPAPLLRKIATRPRGAVAFITARPAGTQDLWQARLYLLKPLIRLSLALMWLGLGAVALLLPAADLTTNVTSGLTRAAGLIDLALAAALLRDIAPKPTALAQLVFVLATTLILTLLAPALWADPLGGLMKNLALLPLILTHIALIEER